MEIRIIRPWQQYAPGQVLTPDLGVADVLIRRGIAEPVEQLVPPAPASHRRKKHEQLVAGQPASE